jgi:hypothetical protein
MTFSSCCRLAAVIAAAAWTGGESPARCGPMDLCTCGPDYCLNDPRYPKLLAPKKDRLRKAGFTEDLIALLDRDGQCVAAVTQGPDTFFIKRKDNGVWDVRELNAEREGYAKADILAGKTTEYYKYNTNRALACCGEVTYDQRPDWNAALDMNLNLVIVCRKSGNAVVCTNAR